MRTFRIRPKLISVRRLSSGSETWLDPVRKQDIWGKGTGTRKSQLLKNEMRRSSETRETRRMKTHPQYSISKPRRSSHAEMTMGIDLWGHFEPLLHAQRRRRVVDQGRFRTNPSGIDKRFRDQEPARVATGNRNTLDLGLRADP